MSRTLRLRREALTELAAGDLAAVAGGNEYSRDAFTCGVRECYTDAVDLSPLTRLTLDSAYCRTFPYC